MKIYSMIVVTERQSRTRLFVDIPTNHKLVIVFSIIRKATPCNKLKKYATNTNRKVTVFLLTKKCKRSTTCSCPRVTYLYKSELAVKDFLSLSFNIFLHVNVTN